jgi:hypothetical protein
MGEKKSTFLLTIFTVEISMIISIKASSPACTELETIVMDWLAKMIGLPDVFLHSSKDSKGGGVIQVSMHLFFLCIGDILFFILFLRLLQVRLHLFH